MASKKRFDRVDFIRGGVLVRFRNERGEVINAAIAAYEGAEDALEDFMEERGIIPRSFDLVCGWEGVNELLRTWGYPAIA